MRACRPVRRSRSGGGTAAGLVRRGSPAPGRRSGRGARRPGRRRRPGRLQRLDEAFRLADESLERRGLSRREVRGERVRRDCFDAQRPQHERQHERRGRIAVVDDDPEPTPSDRLAIQVGEQVVGIALACAGRVADRTDVPAATRRSSCRLKCFSISFWNAADASMPGCSKNWILTTSGSLLLRPTWKPASYP